MPRPKMFVRSGPEIDEAVVSDFERSCSSRLPDDYRQFLLETNGGYPETTWGMVVAGSKGGFVLQRLYAISDEQPALSPVSYEFPNGFLKIGTSICGDPVGMLLKGRRRGQVFWQDHETAPRWWRPRENIHHLADSFGQLLDSLIDLDTYKNT